ncbi:hypothetical protein GQ54DRAFT_297303 [Martensiomyces pterosporus]|nr:hypothetical protein GQ54DRAFT_297303 [Martensiomyces pterosporus]
MLYQVGKLARSTVAKMVHFRCQLDWICQVCGATFTSEQEGADHVRENHLFDPL